MKIEKVAKERLARIAEFPGITVDRVERNKHFKVYLSTPSGKRVLSMSVTPSDWRAWKNNETLLKQWSMA